MRYVRYKKYTGQEADDIDLQELMNRLSDFLLQSGFESQYYGFQEMNPERSMEQLRQAILRALEEGELLPPEMMEELLENPDLDKNQRLREMIDQLIERMTEEGYISPQPPQITPPPEQTPGGQIGTPGKQDVSA
ncbi:MAG: hypothetical protein ACRD37_00890, partial [Candidatus Acidiferrales bacterium]